MRPLGVDEVQPLLDLGHLEDPVHHVGAADDAEVVRVGARGRVELEHQAQAGGVDEADLAQVEDDAVEAAFAQAEDLRLELWDGCDVELADGRAAGGQGVEAARRAVRCGALGGLLRATTAPLTTGRFLDNLGLALRDRSLRIPRDPRAAARELCR